MKVPIISGGFLEFGFEEPMSSGYNSISQGAVDLIWSAVSSRYTAKSSGRSEISRNRFPLTRMSSVSAESSKLKSCTALCNSGSAK